MLKEITKEEQVILDKNIIRYTPTAVLQESKGFNAAFSVKNVGVYPVIINHLIKNFKSDSYMIQNNDDTNFLIFAFKRTQTAQKFLNFVTQFLISDDELKVDSDKWDDLMTSNSEDVTLFKVCVDIGDSTRDKNHKSVQEIVHFCLDNFSLTDWNMNFEKNDSDFVCVLNFLNREQANFYQIVQ